MSVTDIAKGRARVGFAACALLAAGVSGCTVARPSNPFTTTPRVIETPQTVVNADVQIVRDVIEDSARQRGSAIALVGDGLVLQRPLDRSSAEVTDSCGPHQPGRSVRVVLRTRSAGGGRTVLSEERYIVDSGVACQFPLSQADFNQAQTALARIRSQAEAVAGRARSAEAALR